MLFNSLGFLLFFPLVCLLYFLLPQRCGTLRAAWLLVASYYFYMCWSARYALLLAGCTLLTYGAGRLIGRARSPAGRRAWLTAGIVSNLAVLFFFKYVNFALATLNGLLGAVHAGLALPSFDILLPVGISFYTFQALSYVIDVYRGDMPPEPSLLRYALYVSFFPQLVAGPIERSKNLLAQMDCQARFDPDRVRDGLLLMLWGFFEKLVIADRVALLVDTVFNGYAAFGGVERLLAAALFAVQIYCDFGGYSHIAIGAAQVMGFTLMQNFRQPYLAVDIHDFWQRWHISLSSWLRDYLYIPLGGSRCGALRRNLNLLVTFLVSGLWHGAAWNFVAWGGLHAVYQIASRTTAPLRRRLPGLGQGRAALWARRLVTFAFVDAAWVLFRADGIRQAVSYLAGIPFQLDPWVLTDGTLFTLGLDGYNLFALFCALLVLLAVDLLHERGISIRQGLARQALVYRWLTYYAALFAVLIFGIWGPGYDAAAFLYFQF